MFNKNSWYLEQSVVSLISKYIRVAESYYCNCCAHLINIHGKHLHWFMEWHSTVAIWYTFTKIFLKSKPKLNRNPFGSAGFVILLSPHWILDSCCLIFSFLNNIVNQIVFGWKKSSSSSLTKQIPQWLNKKPWK